MKAFLIQVGEEYINWQGMLVGKEHALVLFDPALAKAIADGYANATVVSVSAPTQVAQGSQ